MRRSRHVPKSAASTAPGEPFENPAEAWFWGVQCLLARADGARPLAGLGLVARPCTPDDLLRTIDRRQREGRIGRHHLKVLWDYGCRLFAPDPTRSAEARDARFWDEALDLLGADWRRRGIVL